MHAMSFLFSIVAGLNIHCDCAVGLHTSHTGKARSKKSCQRLARSGFLELEKQWEEAQERQMAEEGFTFEEADALQMQCCFDLPSTLQMIR